MFSKRGQEGYVQRIMNFVLGFVLGSLVGSAAALLLTPLSGDELRSEVRDYTRQVRYEVEQAAAARRAELELELAKMRGEVVTD
jgi:gas vesicle protein